MWYIELPQCFKGLKFNLVTGRTDFCRRPLETSVCWPESPKLTSTLPSSGTLPPASLMDMLCSVASCWTTKRLDIYNKATCFNNVFVSPLVKQPNAGQDRLICEDSGPRATTHHSRWNSSHCAIACPKYVHLTAHSTCTREAFVPAAGFETAIPTSDRSQTLALAARSLGWASVVHYEL